MFNAYLDGKPKLRERYENLKKGSGKTFEWMEGVMPQSIKDKRAFLRAHPDLFRRSEAMKNKTGWRSGEELEKFLADHPDIKKEYEAIAQEIKSGMEELIQKKTFNQRKKEPVIPTDIPAKESVGEKIGGIPEEEFRRFYLLKLEMEEKISIDYWIESRRIERELGKEPEKLKQADHELSKRLEARQNKFLEDRGTSEDEFYRLESLFIRKNLDILFKRHPDVLKRFHEVGAIKNSRMGIQKRSEKSQTDTQPITGIGRVVPSCNDDPYQRGCEEFLKRCQADLTQPRCEKVKRSK